MIFNSYKKNITEYIVIDDAYTEHELSLIKEELTSLIPYLKPVEEIESDTYEEVNSYKKNCLSLWADEYYKQDRSRSNILNFNRKLFCNDITSYAKSINSYYEHLKHCNFDSTLLNFYQSNEHYKSHRDNSMLTALSLFNIGEIQGGGVIFTEDNATVEFKDNRIIIFAGCILHETEPIITSTNSYRVSMAQFINYVQ